MVRAGQAWKKEDKIAGVHVVVPVQVLLGAPGRSSAALLAVGATLFYFSDLAVARQRFVVKSFWNKAWGLPLYFGGQVLIAWSAVTFA